MSVQRLIHVTCHLLRASILLAQGPLTPPGAPAPNFKTLQQVEPRIDLATGDVSNSFGASTGTTSVSYGITSINVTNSTGTAVVATGIRAVGTISFSYGSTGGVFPAAGLECPIAIGSTAIGGENITNKYLMP